MRDFEYGTASGCTFQVTHRASVPIEVGTYLLPSLKKIHFSVPFAASNFTKHFYLFFFLYCGNGLGSNATANWFQFQLRIGVPVAGGRFNKSLNQFRPVMGVQFQNF